MPRTIVKRVPHYPFKGEILYKMTAIDNMILFVYLSQEAMGMVELMKLPIDEVIRKIEEKEIVL